MRRILIEKEQNIKEQFIGIWISLWLTRQGPATDIFDNKNKHLVFL
jgi:hypothetical protein